MLKYLFIILCLNCSFLGSLTAQEDSDNQQIAKEISQQFMSPFCPGRALSDCPSRKADQLKHEILTKLNQGVSRDAVFDQLVSEYGEEYNALPAWQGREALAWWAPIGFFSLLLFSIVIWFYRQKSNDS